MLKGNYDKIEFPTELHHLKESLTSIRSMLNKCIITIAEVNDKEFLNYYARNVVDMAADLFIGYRMLGFSVHNEHKREVAKLFIERAFANAQKLSDPVIRRHTTAMDARDVILEIQ